MIMLLSGPPGVGKTLTAESGISSMPVSRPLMYATDKITAVAESMRAPLYMMSAGDLGLDSSDVETKLSTVLEMCTKWNAILLLDEADVFLEQRSAHDLERNKLVSSKSSWTSPWTRFKRVHVLIHVQSSCVPSSTTRAFCS